MSPLPTETNRNAESMRIFESDFLEFFTHISPVTVVVVWTPIIAYLLLSPLLTGALDAALWMYPLAIVVGLFLWTFAEYIVHRYVFHFEPQAEWQERVIFMFHGVHHAQPQDKTRLVMPLPASIPMAAIFYGLYYLAFAVGFSAPGWVNPVMGGFLIGYVIYDLVHYATHHWPLRTGYMKYLKRHHMIHHYKEPEARFGVSSPLWDWVFGTLGEHKA